MDEPKRYFVTRVMWTEYERGWGQRFDGYSFHINKDHAEEYIRNFLETTRLKDGAVSDYYVSPEEPRIIEVDPLFAMLVYDKKILWDEKDHQLVDPKYDF